MSKLVLISLLVVGSGCAAIGGSTPSTARPFSLEAQNVRVDVDSKGTMTTKIEYPVCLLPSEEKQAVEVKQEIGGGQGSGLLSAVAMALGYFLKILLN